MPVPTTIIPTFSHERFSVIAIGSSTGGPKLVEQIVCGLPADLCVPILIAQHLPPSFTESFTARLDRGGSLSAVHAESGMPVYPGTVYVARGREHMRVRTTPGGRPILEVSPTPTHLVFKPSVDELFLSCAAVYGRKTLAVVLTGIGSDGTAGAAAIKKAGGMVIVQNAETCAVYGMPRSCVEAGVAHAQLDPERIRLALLQLSPEHRHHMPASDNR